MKNEPFVTADGSDSLRSEQFGVPYHSVHGAVQESRHVFINAGLRPALETAPADISILEVGLGTGLNVLLTAGLAARHPAINFRYTALDLFPLPPAEAAALNYPEVLGADRGVYAAIHSGAWGKPYALLPNLQFTKHQADFLGQEPRPYAPASFNIIYYDAFAPASQPELWAPAALRVGFAALRPDGVLVTYCAKGQFKRDLRDVGFIVEPLPGPPGKREMTRGRKPGV